MKITNIKSIKDVNDMDRFFELVDTCKGKVELLTGEGDRLNLKSKLSQCISLTHIFSQGCDIPNLEIEVSEREDMDKISDFIDFIEK